MISKRALLAVGSIGCAILLLILPLGIESSGAQSSWDRDWERGRGRGWGRRYPPRFPDPDSIPDRKFSFCRIMYESVRREPLGHGWNTDYPNSDANFMIRLSQLTKAQISLQENGEPNHVVVALTDDELFDYPFIFMSDVGTVGFSDLEAKRLQEYLLRGGFLYVDDFWGEWAWHQWVQEIGKALPPDLYPIVDVPLDDPIFHVFFNVRTVPQIPSIQYWRRSGGSSTSEQGWDSREPHFRGIRDEKGRLMVVMTHNTDIADGWER